MVDLKADVTVEDTPKCRFGCIATALYRVKLEKGCICYPDDREQLVCVQHWSKMEPLGAAEVVEVVYP